MDAVVSLRTFLAVARYGGFSEAARQLHVVPSVTAKRITQLEKTMGTRLFERSTRKVTLTDAGHQLQGKAATLLAEFDEVVRGFKRARGELQGHLKIMAPTTLTTYYLGDVLTAFMRTHKRVTVEIELIDRSTSPLEEGFDIAISGRAASFENVVDIPLSPVNAALCAAPSYLLARKSISHPRDLIGHDCLVFKPTGPGWQFQSLRGVINVDVTAKLTADDNYTLLKAAIAGQGIAALPGYLTREALSTGMLQFVLPDFPPQQTWFRAYVPSRRQDVPYVSALIQWLKDHMAKLETTEAKSQNHL